jgi:uncharacterized membrane protein
MSFRHALLTCCAAAIALIACGDAAQNDEPPVHRDGAPPVNVPPSSPDISPAPWDAARDRGAAWRGIGQEPGWIVEIDAGGRIDYSGDYGSTTLTAQASPAVTGGGATWVATADDGSDIAVAFEELPCIDVMSGEEFSHTVTVRVAGQELRGCGRRL